MSRREGYVPAGDDLRLYYRMDGEGPDTVVVPLACWEAEDLQPLAPGRTLLFYDPLLIPGVGHMPAIEAPEVFFPAADRFLAGTWPEQAEIVTSTS